MNSKTTTSTPDDDNISRSIMRNCIGKRKNGEDKVDFMKFYELLLNEKGIDVV